MLNFCDFIQVYVFSTNHHLNQSDLQTEETGLLSNCFYCFQSKVQPCIPVSFVFKLSLGLVGRCGQWNISKFPKEDL